MNIRERLLEYQKLLLDFGIYNNELELVNIRNEIDNKVRCTEEIFEFIVSILKKNLNYYTFEKGYVEFWFEYLPFIVKVNSSSSSDESMELANYICSIMNFNSYNLEDILDNVLLKRLCDNEGIMFVQIDRYEDENNIHYYRYYFRVNLMKKMVKVKERINSNAYY